jgi:hypothetical protein
MFGSTVCLFSCGFQSLAHLSNFYPMPTLNEKWEDLGGTVFSEWCVPSSRCDSVLPSLLLQLEVPPGPRHVQHSPSSLVFPNSQGCLPNTEWSANLCHSAAVLCLAFQPFPLHSLGIMAGEVAPGWLLGGSQCCLSSLPGWRWASVCVTSCHLISKSHRGKQSGTG